MPDLVRLDKLRQKIRWRSKLENQTKLITNAELDDLINQYGADLSDLLGSQWLRDSRIFSTISGQDTYSILSIAPNFYRPISVDVYMTSSNTSDVVSAQKFSEEQRNAFKVVGLAWGLGWPVWYRFQGSNLILQPTPPGTFRIGVNYVPTFTSLIQDSDKFDSINGFEDFIVWSCAADIRAELDLDPSFQLQRAEAARQRIVNTDREDRAPETVNDVMRSNDPLWGR